MAEKEELNELLNNPKSKKTIELKKKMYSTVYFILRNKQDSDDAIQETRLVALELSPDKLEAIKDLCNWFCGVAKNKAYAIAKRNGRFKGLDSIEPMVNPTSENKLDLDAIRLIIKEKHNLEDNEIFNLFIEEYKYKDIAENIGKSGAFVRKRIFEIRKTLKKHLGNEGGKNE